MSRKRIVITDHNQYRKEIARCVFCIRAKVYAKLIFRLKIYHPNNRDSYIFSYVCKNYTKNKYTEKLLARFTCMCVRGQKRNIFIYTIYQKWINIRQNVCHLKSQIFMCISGHG